MTSARTVWGIACLGAMVVAVVAGCKKSVPPAAAVSVPVVSVSNPVQKSVQDYVEYTGRIDAYSSVGIKARVTGFLVSIGKYDGKLGKDGTLLFHVDPRLKEGSEVKEGTVLFQIDPRPYEFQLKQAKSQVKVVERQLALAKITRDRAVDSFEKKVGSQQDVDQAEAGVAEAQARLEAASATVDSYELNQKFTTVTAPFDGQIGRFYLLPGNLVTQDQTLLATIVSVDRVYAYFDMDERTLLKINAQVNASDGKIQPPVGITNVFMALEGEIDYKHVGTLDFINNVINPSTGTVSVRGVFDNKKPPKGVRLLAPGMFVRIRLPIGDGNTLLLVVDRAIGSDQGLKYVYVLDAQNKVQYRRVFLGALQDDGLRVIEPHKAATEKEVESGVRPDELVVVGSLPQLRPKMDVSPNPISMPIPGEPDKKP